MSTALAPPPRAHRRRATHAFARGIEINPTFMPCHYQSAVTHAVRRNLDAARSSAAAIVKADGPGIPLDYFIDPRLQDIWMRGREVAGLGDGG
ncbi:MAG: hypothetical protein AB7S70_12840 [Hyphomicrobium sp.]|uniref:hypothetical protein n=1 Tax=Hyphomicrobium sp. TaxID=82 RepID=UPI003D123B68